MSVKKVNKTTGSTTKVAGLVNSEKVNTMYGAFPSDASASNKLVSDSTANEKISDAIADKADKVSSSTNGNFAGLNASGNLTDSGKKADDFATAEELADEAKTRAELGAHNLWDVEKWILDNGVSGYSRSGNTLSISETTNLVKLVRNPYIFSDSDISVIVSATFSGTIKNPKFEILNSSGTVVGTVNASNPSATATGCKVRLEYATGGTVDMIAPMIRLATDTDTTYQPYAKTNQQLTKETTGLIDNDFANGAVNLLPLITYTNRQFGDATNGYITVNSNADGSFTLNGSRISTASVLLIPIIKDGKYLLTDNIIKRGKSYKYTACPSNSASQHLLSQINYRDGSNNLVQYEEGGNGVVIDIPNNANVGNCNIAVYHDADFSNVVVKPMITLASTPNSDYKHYVPYAKSNSVLTEDVAGITDNINRLGAKNLIPFNLAKIKSLNTAGTWTDNVYTPSADANVTFTVNSDGTVKITGNNTANVVLKLTADVKTFTQNQNYIVSGCPSGGSINTYYLQFTDNDGISTHYYEDVGNEKEFTYYSPSDWNSITIGLKANAGANGKVFKPMLRLASDTDSIYQLYAKTNRQLTEDSVDWESNSVLGAKNFLTTKGTATTQGVLFERDENGVFTVTRQTANSNHAYYSNGRFTLKPGTYIFSNGYNSIPSGIQATYLYNHTDSKYFINCNNGPKSFTITEEKEFAFNIEVQSSQSPNGVKIYPMIRLASDNDATYQPYAKTNRELTKVVTNQLGDATLAGTYLSDCNNVASSGTLNLYGASTSTANSPYTTGVETSANSFVILSRVDTNTNWGMQLAIPMTSTKGIYMRFKASGTWGTWSKITP